MRSQVTLVLLLLNAVLFLFIFRFERDWRTERAATEVRHRVLGAEAADIRSLEVARPAGGSFRLERRGENWFLTKPLEWPANPQAVRAMITELQLLDNQTSFRVADLAKNGQSLEDYGLARPKMTIAFTSGGDAPGTRETAATLRLGDTTQVGNRLYLLSDDGARIHVVDRELEENFSQPLDKIRSDSLMTIPVFEARSLNLQAGGAGGVRVGIRLIEGRWSFESPILSRADRTAVVTALNGLSSLRVQSFPASAPSPAPAAAPTLQARVEGDNRSETLLVGEGAGTGPDEFYAQLKDGDELRPAVFVVRIPGPLMADLRNAQEALRERRILDFEPAAVTAVTLAAPNQPELTLRRVGDAADWEAVRRGAGSQPVGADRDAVQRLLEQLAQLAAVSFKSDEPRAADLENWGLNRPEREITLSLGAAGSAPSRIVLSVGLPSQPDGLAYARLNSAPNSIYAVKTDILDQTPVAPRDWRDRLLRNLPESSVASISLVDLASGEVLYRHELAAGESWAKAFAAEPAARSRALAGLLDGSRALKAKNFILDAYGDQVNVGGEERTWRYRLDLGLSTNQAPGRGAAAPSISSLWLTERVGGTWQYAGSPEFGAVFALEQPMIDALWTLTYARRDPGAPPEGGARP